MKLNKAPCGVSQTVPIVKGSPVTVEGEERVKGGILKGTKYAWLCQGPFLKIIDVSNGEKIAGWRFGASCSEFVTDVTCAVELPYSDDVPSLKQIVLGLECEVIGGMICIFDVQGSRLLRAIRIPGKPLSLSIVDSGSSGCEGRYPLPGLLSSMSGIIAVGLEGGKVFLVDLCRLSCEELLNTWFNDDREEVHDEMNPCQLLPINKDDDDSDALEKKCANAAVSGDHLCLLLNEGAFVQDNFLLLEPGGEVSGCFKAQNVGVTSLFYIPHIASLVVGYSFGCFQLWNLMHLTLNYTSRMMKDPLPVTHLGFQEPSDDPCNFCYLWAVHSSTDDFPSSSPPVGIMYALSYDSKEWVDGYGCLYQDYQSCHFRFEYNLEVDASDNTESIMCVSFITLSNIPAQKNMPDDGYDEVTSENDFSLCIFAWEAYDSENKPISTYLSLFDLNQWYKDQMPSRMTDTDEETLGYLVTFSLNCIRQKSEGVSENDAPLLDIRVDPENLSQFKSFQPQEEHFHPSALSFVSHCLLEDRIVSLSHPGLQRYLLLYMEKEGPICLLRPLNLFKHCVMVGLKPVLVDVNGACDVSAVTQREFLLSVALENQMLGFLHRCASDWANGSVSGVDCSLPMLLTWGFERAIVLKETADGLCVHLFDHSGIRLDKNEYRLLDNCASQLRQLATLFEGILGDCRLYSLLNMEDFKQKTNELTLVALYFEVLLWFLNVGLLPEFPENSFDHEPRDLSDLSVDKIPYPATVLTKFYADRRHEFKTLNLKNCTKASLYIDQLLQNEVNGSELTGLWQSDGGSGMYPPPSIQSLLAMYLQDGIDIQTKNSIVIYVFLDLATLLDPERYSRTIEYFVKFPCAFCMTPSIIKVTQAFWLLDQRHFEDALDMVLDPLVSPKDLQPWQHRFIVQALLSQGQHSKALEYFTVRQLPIQGIEDIQLKITLLVMNKQVTQAYNFLQQYNNEENNRDLLYHFYQECGKAQQLGTVLKLMLSPTEEELLMNYLQSCTVPQSDDMQVVFYLMRSRVIEAVAVNDRINFSGTRKVGGRRPRNDPNVRDVLVGGYAKTLPSVTRQLASYCSQQKKSLSNWRQVQRPTPMSVDVHYGIKQPVSYKSSLIHATLEKARETWMMPFHSSYSSDARNKEGVDVPAMQNLPFLCTTHDTLRHDRETTPVVFPSVASIKRRLDEDGSASLFTPSKRSRLDNSSPLENYLLLSNKKKNVQEHSANSSLLLKSPLVKRVTPMKVFKDWPEKNGSKPFAETFTPQSILKVRNLVRSSTSPEHQPSGASNIDWNQEKFGEWNKEKLNEEKSCSRQIRFSLPVVSDPEEDQPLSSSTPSKITNRVKTPKRIVDASPRLPIRSSLSVLQKSIVELSEEVSSTNVTEKKIWTHRTYRKKISGEDNVFVFGSESSTNTINNQLDIDKVDSDNEVPKLNDSHGEDSFYSAASSSDSGPSKDDVKTDSDHNDVSPSQSEKYIHTMKEIKPRRQLSRLKSGSHSSLTSSFSGKPEIGREIEIERNSLSSSEEEDNNDIADHSIENNEIPKEFFIVSRKSKLCTFSMDEDDDTNNDGNEVHDNLNVMSQKNVSVQSGVNQYSSSSEENDDESEDNSNVDVSKKSILGDTFIGNITLEQSQNVSCTFSEDEDDDTNNSGDKIHDNLSGVSQKNISVHSEVNQCSSGSEDNDESKDNSNVGVCKTSILGDTFIGNITLEQSLSVSSNINLSNSIEISESLNENHKLLTEEPDPKEESPISKIQDIKGRRPLSRLSTHGKLDANFMKSMLGKEKYSQLELSLSKKDNIDASKIGVSDMEVDERLGENESDIDDLGGVERTVDVEETCTVEISRNEELVGKNNDGCHSLYSEQEKRDWTNISAPVHEENQIAWDGKSVVCGEDSYRTTVQGNVDVYCEVQNNDLEYQNISTVHEAGRNEIFSRNEHVDDLVLDGEKTYVSLTAVTTEQSSYGHLLPPHHMDVGHGISITPANVAREEDRIYHSTLVSENQHCEITIPCRTFFTEEDVHSGKCAEIVDSNVKDNKRTSLKLNETKNTENITEQCSSSAGDTSGTIEVDSDEHEVREVFVESKSEHNSSGLCGLKDDPLVSTVNINDICDKQNNRNDEIVIVDSDSENNKVICSNHVLETETNKESLRSQETERHDPHYHKNTAPDKDLCINQENSGGPLVLKLSDSENDSESSHISIEDTEEQTKTKKVSDHELAISSHYNVTSSTVLPSFNSFLTSEVPKEKVSEFINEVSSDEIKCCNKQEESIYLNNNKENNVIDTKVEEESVSDTCVENEYHKETAVAKTPSSQEIEQTGSKTLHTHSSVNAEQVCFSGSTPRNYSQIQGTVISENTRDLTENAKLEQTFSGTGEGHYPLRGRQKRSSSVQSEPPQMSDVSLLENEMKEHNFENRREHSSLLYRRGGQRRRNSSQTEPVQVNEELLAENKNEMEVLREDFTIRTKQRNRPSSVQSEPPQIDDVCMQERETKDDSKKRSAALSKQRRQQSSLQIESVQMDQALLENKCDVRVNRESSTSEARLRSRPSSVLSEPPQMADVLPQENQVNDEDINNSMECASKVKRHRRRRSSLQFDSVQLDQTLSGTEGDIGVSKKSSTPKTRLKCRSNSLQSESSQMTEMLLSDNRSEDHDLKVSEEHSDVLKKPTRRRRNSLQFEPMQVNEEQIIENRGTSGVMEESFTPKTRQRSRPSSTQSEPPKMSDVSEHEEKHKMVEHFVKKSTPRRGRRTLHVVRTPVIDTSKDNLEIKVSEENSTPRTRLQNRPTSVQSEPSDLANVIPEDPEYHVKHKILHSESVASTSLTAPNVSVPLKIPEKQTLSEVHKSSPSVSSEPALLRMNLRSHRSISVDKELFGGKEQDREADNTVSDLDSCSVQSEPPQLSDVSHVRQLRSNKPRKISLKKKSKKTTYFLKIPSSKLACVKEEPESECGVGDGAMPSAHSESEMSPVYISGRVLRNRKVSESASSQTSSVGVGQQLQRHVDIDSGGDSPTSINSKSTVVLDKSNKRKRCQSPSSPEVQETKKFLSGKQEISESGDVAEGPLVGKSGEGKETISDDAIEQYATARRLTRYQKTLMERSMDVTRGVHHKFHGSDLPSERSTEESDGESEVSGYTSGSSHVRSSARLQEKRHVMMDRSPSQSSRVSGDLTPQKLISKHHSSKSHPSAEHGENSPGSIYSGKSPSSVTSSQWPSPTSGVPKPRRKSFQNAQKALFSPSTKKLVSDKTSATDTSEAESVGENDKTGVVKHSKYEGDAEAVSEAESGKSQSSAVSSTWSRSTRSSAKNMELPETIKLRVLRDKKGSFTEGIPQKHLQQNKGTSSSASSSTEDSPKKDLKMQEEIATSQDDQLSTQELHRASNKPDARKSYSAFRTRKYLKIHSKRKSAM